MKLALLGAAVAATASAGQCPPKEWERCGKPWPPADNGPCCSKAGWVGSSKWHCEAKYGGYDAVKDGCCTKDESGSLTCKDDSKTVEDIQKEKEEEMQCPPKGWDRCGVAWPPTRADANCCSSHGFIGNSKWHCKKNGGIDPKDHCCKVKEDGTLDCITGKGFEKQPKKPSDPSESSLVSSDSSETDPPVSPDSSSTDPPVSSDSSSTDPTDNDA